jgi:DNA-binding transcriptional MerR regulator
VTPGLPPLTSFRDARFFLDDLVDTASRYLRHGAFDVADGRVAASIEARNVRFYQTTGLLNPPRRYDGRKAVYEYRHLLQVLAIRRLQAEGHPLAAIQASLPAQTTQQLEAALLSSLGTAPAPRAPQPPPSPRRLVTVELAPGITVTIDPEQVRDADTWIARLTRVIASRPEDIR